MRSLIKAMYFSELKFTFFIKLWFSFALPFSFKYNVCRLVEVELKKDLIKYPALKYFQSNYSLPC